MTFMPQGTRFGFLVLVYDRVSDGDKFLILKSLAFILSVT